MKHLISILIIMFIFIGLSCQKNASEPEQIQNTKIGFLPNEINQQITDTTSVEIKIDDLSTSVFGISLQIDYDSGLIGIDESKGFEQGTFFESEALVFYKLSEDRIYLSLTLLRGNSPVNGSGTLGKFSFYGKSSGISNLRFRQTSTYFYNANGEEMTLSGIDFKDLTINLD